VPDRPEALVRVEVACRGCGAAGLTPVLDLGELPLANALLEEKDLGSPEPRFPLHLVFCPACTLVQIRETVRPDVLFSRYVYFSSYADATLAHAAASAAALTERLGLGPQSLVLEIASNDGYLLRSFAAAGIPVLGIEPAENVAAAAEARGIRTLRAFFGGALAQRLRAEGVRPDAILGNNVLAHVDDLPGFARGVAALLAPGGLAVFEFPYVADLIERTEFDTIYHEHLCYFSLHAVQGVFARAGLVVVDVERLPIHGGSLRISLAGPAAQAAQPSVERLLGEERAAGLTGERYYGRFAEQVEQLREELMAELRARKAAGQRLAAYGASAKGSTLMNAFGIGRDLLDFVVDRSPVKQGRFTPGNHLPIVSPDALERHRPDAVLLLTWNFAEEILAQQRPYLEMGGTFLLPVPALRTVSR
jgi:SAM-dependent methyltransferase